jgi:hypothetical protein
MEGDLEYYNCHRSRVVSIFYWRLLHVRVCRGSSNKTSRYAMHSIEPTPWPMGHGAAVAMIDPDAPPGTAKPSQSLKGCSCSTATLSDLVYGCR